MHHPVRRRKRRSHGVCSSNNFNSIGVRSVDVVRGHNGFGFTISGQQPCLLSCIVAGSPAEAAGLRPGHALVAVNGRSVAKLPHDTVVRLIGSCAGTLRLHVAENYYPHSSDSDVEDVDAYLPRRPAQGRAARVVRDLHTGAMFVEKSIPACSPPLQLPPRGAQNPPPPPPPSRIQPSDFRAVVGYLGTIELPKVLLPGSKLAVIRSCVRRMRAEKRVHTTVMLIVRKEQSVILADSLGTILAEFVAERVAFCGACADDKRFFGLVTSVTSVDDDDEDVSAACGGSSCHVFMVDPSVHPHAAHEQRAAAFRIVCTTSGEGCAEFPALADPILRAVAALYNPASPPPPPPRSNTSSCPSSNSDSGIGFREEPALVDESTAQERLTVRAMPDPPCVAVLQQQQLKLSPKVYGLPVAQSLEDLPPAAAALEPSGDESMSSLEHHQHWGSLQDLRTMPVRHPQQAQPSGRRRKHTTHHQHPPSSSHSSISASNSMPPPQLVASAALSQPMLASLSVPSSAPSPQPSDDETDCTLPFKRWCSGSYVMNPMAEKPLRPQKLDFSDTSLLDSSPLDPYHPLRGLAMLESLDFSSNISPVVGTVNPEVLAKLQSTLDLRATVSPNVPSNSTVCSESMDVSMNSTLDVSMTDVETTVVDRFQQEKSKLLVTDLDAVMNISTSELDKIIDSSPIVNKIASDAPKTNIITSETLKSRKIENKITIDAPKSNKIASEPLRSSNIINKIVFESQKSSVAVPKSNKFTFEPLKTSDVDNKMTTQTQNKLMSMNFNFEDEPEMMNDRPYLLRENIDPFHKKPGYFSAMNAKVNDTLRLAHDVEMIERFSSRLTQKSNSSTQLVHGTKNVQHASLARVRSTVSNYSPESDSPQMETKSIMPRESSPTPMELVPPCQATVNRSEFGSVTSLNSSMTSMDLLPPCMVTMIRSQYSSVTSLDSMNDITETPITSRHGSCTSVTSDLHPPCQMTINQSSFGSITSLNSMPEFRDIQRNLTSHLQPQKLSLGSITSLNSMPEFRENTRSIGIMMSITSNLQPPTQISMDHCHLGSMAELREDQRNFGSMSSLSDPQSNQSNLGSVTSLNSMPELRETPSKARNVIGSLPSLMTSSSVPCKRVTFNLPSSPMLKINSSQGNKEGDSRSGGTCRSHSEGGNSEAEPGRGGPNSCFDSFERLLDDPNGMHAFAEFLKKEFSHENIYFWVACEKYRRLPEVAARKAQARAIFQRHLGPGAPEPVNVDSQARQAAREGLDEAKPDLFVSSQKQIFNLMKFDSYPRFLKSDGRDEPGPMLELDPDLLLHAADEPNPGKLKKSRSDAEERRRKSLLPWHRGKSGGGPRTRSKSRDREAGSTGVPEAADSASSVRSELTGSRSSLASSDLALIQRGSSSRQSLSSGEAAELCRVHLPDGATTVLATQRDETAKQLVARLLEKRGLQYSSFELFLAGSGKPVPLGEDASAVLGGQEVRVEQRVVFRLDLPSRKTVGVKAKAGRTLAEVLRPILHKYGYRLDNTTITLMCDPEPLDPSLLITAVENQRLQATVTGPDGWRDRCKQQQQQQTGGGATLDEITNRVFEELLQGKTEDSSGPQSRPLSDHGSIRSEDWSSEHSSGIFGRFLRRDSAFLDKTRESRSKGKKCVPQQQQVSKHASLDLDSPLLGSQPALAVGPTVTAAQAQAAAAKAKWKLRPQAHGRSESDELYEGLKRAQRRMDDQRGTEINFELPDFLKDKENAPQQRRLKKGRLTDMDVSLPLLGGGDGIDLSVNEGVIPSPGQAEAYFSNHMRCSLAGDELAAPPAPPQRHNNAPPPLPPKPKTFPALPRSKWNPSAGFSSASEEDSGNNNTRPATQSTTSFV